jgi:glycosyltransferase involved in cell wall biosynthesis
MERAAIALTPTLIREAFGRAALEAHAGGAALVSSGRGGLREVSGDACLYADPDKPASLAHALDRLIRNEALRNRLALEGRLRAQRLFDIRACAADLDDFYEEVAAQAAVSGGA